jgi:hypothetical protein
MADDAEKCFAHLPDFRIFGTSGKIVRTQISTNEELKSALTFSIPVTSDPIQVCMVNLGMSVSSIDINDYHCSGIINIAFLDGKCA